MRFSCGTSWPALPTVWIAMAPASNAYMPALNTVLGITSDANNNGVNIYGPNTRTLA